MINYNSNAAFFISTTNVFVVCTLLNTIGHKMGLLVVIVRVYLPKLKNPTCDPNPKKFKPEKFENENRNFLKPKTLKTQYSKYTFQKTFQLP